MEGITFNNLRKALFLIMYGNKYIDMADDFSFEKYKYIIPMQNQFTSPISINSNNTYIMFWIDADESLTNDRYENDGETEWKDTTICKANIMLRFVGKRAEELAKTFRHHFNRSDVWKIWKGVCNADKLEWVSAIRPVRVGFYGNNTEICFDINLRFKYNESINVNWNLLEGFDIDFQGEIKTEEEE